MKADVSDVVGGAGLLLVAVCLWILFGVPGVAVLGVVLGAAMTLFGIRGGK